VLGRLGILLRAVGNELRLHVDEEPVEVFEALLAEGIIVRDFGTLQRSEWLRNPEDTDAPLALTAAVREARAL